ncbi:energy-coupling factor transporter ATP-binding protein EcfA2 [Kribbella aluminosa]|uniref:Energy-coupling factor transporter ATP-binding protein EcfA2 n=1 Tax=Kribbella aluminosa TaxID=416017 RepID=A0ABS4V048_9ACTN|nr:energy-coupling factor transporter ATP-binding protein EcfA2 [Kribbella aluminosa]
MSAMLEVKDLEVAYGKIVAVKKISFSVEQGQVVSLIGTNGAGKTTTLKTISGLLRPTSGEIWFQGERIDHVAAHDIVSRGPGALARGTADLPAALGRGEPDARRVLPQGSGGGAHRSAGGVRPVPDPRGAAQAAGRYLLRW